MSNDRTRISVQIPDDDYKLLMQYAERKRISLSDVVREALVQLLERIGKRA